MIERDFSRIFPPEQMGGGEVSQARKMFWIVHAHGFQSGG
jgi:hypothetical protein